MKKLLTILLLTTILPCAYGAKPSKQQMFDLMSRDSTLNVSILNGYESNGYTPIYENFEIPIIDGVVKYREVVETKHSALDAYNLAKTNIQSIFSAKYINTDDKQLALLIFVDDLIYNDLESNKRVCIDFNVLIEFKDDRVRVTLQNILASPTKESQMFASALSGIAVVDAEWTDTQCLSEGISWRKMRVKNNALGLALYGSYVNFKKVVAEIEELGTIRNNYDNW